MTRLQFLASLLAAPFAAMFGKSAMASTAAPAVLASESRLTMSAAKAIHAACVADARKRLANPELHRLTPDDVRTLTALCERVLA